jgi:hypothetical protein
MMCLGKKPLRFGALAALLFILVLPQHSSASTRADILEGAPVLRHAKLLHEGRHGITPSLATILNDAYHHNVRVGLRYDFYLANWAGIGIDLGYNISFNNDLGNDVSAVRTEFRSTNIGLDAMAGITLVPFYGKMKWMEDSSIRYDAYFRFSGGIVQVVGDGVAIANTMAVAPRLAFGAHFFVSKQAALVVELTDTLVSMNTGTDFQGGVGSKELMNIISLNIGFLIHFPSHIGIGR